MKTKQHIIFLSIGESSELLRVDKSTIRRWIAEDLLTGYRMGRRVLLDREEVEKKVLANRIPTYNKAKV